MKRVLSGEGVTDVQAALGGPDHVVPDVVVEVEPPFNKDIREQYSVGEVTVEPTRRLEGAPLGDRPSEVKLIGDDRQVPVSPRLDEIAEPQTRGGKEQAERVKARRQRDAGLVAKVREAIQGVPFTDAGDAQWDKMAEAAVAVFQSAVGAVSASSDLVDARGYVERALTEDGVLTLPELHLCNALVRVVDYLVALQEEV